jgi:hypothetical protein
MVRLQISDPASPFLQFDRNRWGRSLSSFWSRAEGESRWVFVEAESEDDDTGPFTVRAIERSTGAFSVPAGATLVEESPLTIGSVEGMKAVLEASEGRGAAPLPGAGAIESAVQRSGLSRGEVIWLLTGFPGIGEYANDFLGKELRTALGLKMAEAKTAKERLLSVRNATLLKVFDAALAGPATDLWDAPDRVLDRLITAWIADRGVRVPIPEQLVAAANAAGILDDPTEQLEELSSPSGADKYTRDGDWAYDTDGDLNDASEGEVFDSDAMMSATRIVAWVASATQVGDPLRAKIPELYDLLRQRLAHPKLLFDLGFFEGKKKAAESMFRSLSGKPYALRGELPEVPPEAVDTGSIVAVLVLEDDSIHVGYRPTALGVADKAWIEKQLSMFDESVAWRSLMVALSPGLAAIAERVRTSPLPDGAWEEDPGLSAPEVVAEVKKTLGLSEEAAELFLQTLALAAPTKKAVVEWNGWTNQTYAKAAAELVGKGLVVEAKRSRAGRDHFLPGGWVERKRGPLPFEAWKLPLYQGTDDGELPLGDIVPLRPIHELFEVSWARYRDGDRP